jgi:hypothetical protein
MDLKITTKSGGTIEIQDAVEVQMADGPIAPDFITKELEPRLSPSGVPITVTST